MESKRGEFVPREGGNRSVGRSNSKSASRDVACEAKSQDIIPLNLVTTYPVRWSRFQVLRDLLQNFFDSVPNEEFASRVRIQVSKSSAELRVEGVVFSHEWLVPIGASSKTHDDQGKFAGYFGEGFKVAALCATRDHGWGLRAGSGPWSLEVITLPLVIDGTTMETLAYRVCTSTRSSQATWLRLERFGPNDQSLLRTTVLWSFYYPENPLFDKLVWADQATAVWTRSTVPLPELYPRCSSGRGILFVGRQARGSHELPFVVAAHDLRDRDRERSRYYDFQVVDALAGIAPRLPAHPSSVLLEAASRHWREYRKRKYQVGSWEPVVRNLVRNVALDPAVANTWRERHPKLLVVAPVRRGDVRSRNRRAEAMSWVRSSGQGWRMVQDAFFALGYPSLEEECRARGGFLGYAEPSPEDLHRIELLLSFVRHYLFDLIPLEPLPKVRIVEARSAGWGGYAVCHRRSGGPYSSRGRRIRYDLIEVALSSAGLRASTPQQAMATLLHELCHAFGTDRARSFGDSLTDVLERVAALPKPLESLARDWTSAPNDG